MIKTLVFLILLISVTSHAVDLSEIEAMLAQENHQIDIAAARLKIESLVYDDVDIPKVISEIDRIASVIKSMDDYGDTSLERVGAILRYLYTPGDWNSYKPYKYNHADPFGKRNPEGKSVANYLVTREGNCVSMPLLILILSQRLGTPTHLAIAPHHAFIKFVELDGSETNIESTSGTLLRDESYIRAFGVTEKAIDKGTYLKPLNAKQAVAFMLYELGRKLLYDGDLDGAQQVAQLMLENNPKSVDAMLLNGNANYFALNKHILDLKDGRVLMVPELKFKMAEYYRKNLEWYEKAEALGWLQPAADFDEKYAASIERFKSKR